MPEAPKIWTVYVAHQANPFSSISWGASRKWKTFEINKKVRMDSPSEFTATIEYDSGVTFNDLIRFERDGAIQWIGFVEDIQIGWDENGRYLDIGGRDLTLLLWRKYVENFNNSIANTLGFFGNVDAVELIKFLLRTPRSDLPEVENDSIPVVQSIYPYNKEGWGIDISNFLGLETSKRVDGSGHPIGYGDINTTILRRREMIWGNSGSPFNSSDPATEGIVNGLGTMNWDHVGSSPYIVTPSYPTSYIKSNTNVNNTAEFTFAPLAGGDGATAINSCYISINQAPDASWGGGIWQSNCQVYIWVNSVNAWCHIGNFGGKSSVFGPLAWQTYIFDLSTILGTVSDVNLAKVRFVETGSLATYIQYVYLSTGYNGRGDIQSGEWVNIEFNSMECIGVYIESREHPDQFPQNYHITTVGGQELFSGYIEHDGDTYITLDTAKDQLIFNSYQSNDPSKIAYFYRQGISEGHSGPIGDFDESFSFAMTGSQPCSDISSPYNAPAFIPWCLANDVGDFYTIYNSLHNFTCFDVVNISGVLYPQFRLRSGGGAIQEHKSTNVLALNAGYWLHVTRIGLLLRYRLYNAQTMRDSELIGYGGADPFDYTVTCADLYTYRYQAITYNHEDWAQLFSNSMDVYLPSGEQILNPSFESGTLTPWAGSVTVTSAVHYTDGNWSAEFTAVGQAVYQIFTPVIPDTHLDEAYFYYLCPVGSKISVILTFDGILSPTTYYVDGTGGWTKADITSHWGAGYSLAEIGLIYLGPSTPAYVDHFSITLIGSGWTTADGTATRTNDTTHQKEGAGCQKIHCTANGQYYYFEDSLPLSPQTILVDAWIRAPPPHSGAANGDVLVDFGSGYHGTPLTPRFLTAGAYPYVRDSSNMNSNHLYFTADNAPSISFNDYVTFDSLANSFPSFIIEGAVPTSNCKISVQARIQNNILGVGTLLSAKIKAYLYVSHSNSWVLIGDSGSFTQITWQNLFTPADVSPYLTSYKDWEDARVKFTYYEYGGTTGDPSKAQFQIGQVKFAFVGTISGGQVELIKVYNSSVGIGTPSVTVGVRPSTFASSDANSMRYYINTPQLVMNGEWVGSLPAGGSTGADFPVPDGFLSSPDPWVHIRLYVHIGSGDGYVKLYNTTSGSEVLLCQILNLNNVSLGLPNRVRYEADYGSGSDYGNSPTYDTYLDAIEIYDVSETITSGIINAGYGPEVTLVTVTDNFYPDLLHSWCPQTMSNIKIYVDDDETGHGWEITQIYVYRTDPVKYRVVLDSCTALTDEYKLVFNSSGYTDCANSDNGLLVYRNSFTPANLIGTLLNFDNDNLEWRVDVTGGNYIPQAGNTILLYTPNGGSGVGTGTLSTDAPSVWSGGPYLFLDDANIDLSTFTQDELVMLGPTNIPKNRLLDIMWDICVQVNDNYTPFEWWITYPSVLDPTRCIGDFHMGSRKGSDKSGSVSFTTGINMEGAKYQKSSRDTYQRCQLIGTGEGKNQDNCSSFWQNDQDAMDEIQGYFEDIITQKQVSGGRIANRYAKVKLKLDASPKRKNAIECIIGRDIYASNTYDVGDDVTLTDFLSGLAGSYRLWNSKTKVDNGGELVTLTAQAPYLDISNVWKDVYKQLKTIGAQGTIAQDWAGQGTQSDKVGADKLTTLFSVTAKNEETIAQSTNDPQWYSSNAIGPHNSGWKADSGNLSIWGGDSGGLGVMWVEARYNTQYDTNGVLLQGEEVDITMDQEPKFTASFKIYEPPVTLPTTYWKKDDYVDFGMFSHDAGTGFLIRVLCSGPNEFKAYAVYCSVSGDYVSSIDTLINNGKAKLLCGLTFNHKYKATITVEYNGVQYGNPLPEVVVSITDEEANNPVSQNVVWTKFNSPSFDGGANSVFQNITIRPIYILCSGTGDSSHRCQMMFYDIKTERDVI